MRLAILSDVHANLPALEAVLDDIAAAGVDARYALGDLVGYAPWPNEVLERLAAERFPIVMGNYDDGTAYDRDECGCAYNNPVEEALGDRSFAWTKEHVTDANRAWLRTLQPQIRFEADGLRFLLVHGSPRRINEYLYEDRPDSSFAHIAAMADADVIVCGHTHRPYDKTVAGARFINVGSAGKPKDGDPRPCWALIETSAAGVTVEFRRVAYDIEATAAAILASDLPAEFVDQLREARGYAKPVPACEDRRAGAACGRRSVGRTLGRAGGRPAGSRTAAERLPRLRRGGSRPVASRGQPAPPGARSGGRRSARAAVPGARSGRPRSRAVDRRAA